ncbi:DUF551 domain-containing protein [Salmonella enterica]|uniref:DUF551 domain-containing protein n=1 Tax=Salmonella enterica TaxID=28901 RepID=UPI003CF35886
MTELTKEQLIEEAKLKIAIAKCHPNSEMARVEGELFKIALASLEAEPVAWKATFTQIDNEYNTFTTMYSDKAEVERWVRLHEIGDFRAEITLLYTAQPAPVVPDKLPREYIRGWPLAYSDYAEGWNDCREAMLQSGNFRENKNSSTNNFREISETSTSSPGTPAGWISCSERMPDDGQQVIILCDGAFVLYAQYRDSEFFDVVRNGEEFFETQSRNVTHWMPLPEPPQEVNQ